MHYDVDIDPDNLNTSHGLVIDLVGHGRRVLDVGCSTGQLGRLLTERENKVCGVELDPEAAAIAEGRLEKVLVADLESVNLVKVFGRRSFDVLVFADVLEHLRDPTAVLSQSRELLSDGGFIVVSLPNVAHGAVRLGLLDGRFEYRDLGLLDRTHLRFFTKSTVDSFLQSSGFVATRFRRTTADVFATEIPLNPASFSDEVVKAVARSAESETYQFVVKAIPVESSVGSGEIVAAIAEKDRELDDLRARLSSIAELIGRSANPPIVGLLSWASGPDGETAIDVIRRETLAAELRRRLHGLSVRSFVMAGADMAGPQVGDTVTPLLPWSDAHLDQVAAETSTIVVTGPLPARSTAVSPAFPEVLNALVKRGCRVLLVGASLEGSDKGTVWPPPQVGAPVLIVDGGEGRTTLTADPLVLSDRLYGPAVLDSRAAYLRVTGVLAPGRRHIVASLSADLDQSAPALSRGLTTMDSDPDVEFLFLDPCPDVERSSSGETYLPLLPSARLLDPRLDPIDLLAVLQSADAVVSDQHSLLALAAALRVPYMAFGAHPSAALDNFAALTGDPDLVIPRADQLSTALPIAQMRAADPLQRDRLTDQTEIQLDDLIGVLTGATSAGLTHSIGSRLVELNRRLFELETANAGLQRRLTAERLAFGGRAATILSEPEPPTARISPAVLADAARAAAEAEAARLADAARAAAEAEAARAEVSRLTDELTAVYNLKTMRMLRPARNTYQRWRSRSR